MGWSTVRQPWWVGQTATGPNDPAQVHQAEPVGQLGQFAGEELSYQLHVVTSKLMLHHVPTFDHGHTDGGLPASGVLQ